MSLEFTEEVKKVITHIAREEAARMGHDYIGPEHLLLALIRNRYGLCAEVIQGMGVELDALRIHVEKLCPRSVISTPLQDIRYTPRGHKIMEFARDEAQLLNHTYVGTEHILLGLLREGQNVATKALMDMSITYIKTKNKIMVILKETLPGRTNRDGYRETTYKSSDNRLHDFESDSLVVSDDLELFRVNIQYEGELFEVVDKNRIYLREWLPWLDATTKVEDIRQYITQSTKFFDKQMVLNLVIRYNQEIVGVLGFNSIDWGNRNASIGYWLSKDMQGKGIMTNSCKALIDYAFNSLDLTRIQIKCATQNKKSKAIPERLGFTLEGTLRQAEWLYDHFVDHAVYGLLRGEWNK